MCILFQDALGFTPLHLISWNSNPSAPDQSISLLRRLFNLGANMNQNPSPFHPITIAMENCLFHHVTFLIKHAGMDLELDEENVGGSLSWDYFSIMSPSSSANQHGVVIPNARSGDDDDNEEVSDHVRYILRSGLSINALTLAAMIHQSPLTALMLKCLVYPRRHLLVDAVRAWCLVGNAQETPIRVWYLNNLQEFCDSLSFITLFDLCRIKLRRSIGYVCLHRKINSLSNVPDKVKNWLKLESL